MNFEFTAEQQRFMQEVRAFLAAAGAPHEWDCAAPRPDEYLSICVGYKRVN